MTSLRQYRKGIYYYGRAVYIYAHLKRYLHQGFKSDLAFENQINEAYFYDSPYYNRTKQYMHANHFFGELLCLLRDKVMQKEERRRFANLSSCAPIFDDFFENNADLSHIHQLLVNPKKGKAQNDEEKMAVHFLNNILNSLADKIPFIEAAEDLFTAQTDSKKQKDLTLTAAELLDISIRKGGYSGLMYTLLLHNSTDNNMLETGYLLGSFGQLMDDVFDIYDDSTDGIRTFANQSESVKNLSNIISIYEQKVVQRVQELDQLEYQTSHFLNVFSIFSTTIQLALNQYEKLEKETGLGPNQCLSNGRKKWIVDMETRQNIWRLFSLSLKKL
ncbi:MAG: class 1 isoprenoid biosynthesis enzyme [Bacteroidales bacterium]|nr:class 1 isoprenoid biosynthesis enzyme [Bacteroidales bacterium]